MNWERLARGELSLTVDILVGFAAGTLIVNSGLADKLLRRLLPRLERFGVGASLGAALVVSVGSARSGAAVIASALDCGRIGPRTAVWGTLLLAFPAYLRRWATTMILACGLAKGAGAVFALTLLFRSAAKFAIGLFLLGRGEHDDASARPSGRAPKKASAKGLALRLSRALPLAWLFYALALLLVPPAERALRAWLKGSSFFPLASLGVAAASFAHVSAALALAGGALAAGEMTAPQAVFALLFGNSLSLLTRLARTNAPTYFGLFPPRLARSMLFKNAAITTALALSTLAAAALPLIFQAER